MSNNIYRNRMMNSINSALQNAKDTASVGHAGLVGRYRELVLEGMLRPVIPSDYGIGTGKIVDSTGQTSGETDLIIYHRNSIPPIMWSERDGIFPIEACRYAIEVKSRLTSKAIKDTIENAKRLLNLKERRRSMGGNLLPTSLPIALFAFDSDVEGMSKEISRYMRYDSNSEKNPLVNVICIAKNGYAAFNIITSDGWVGDNSEEDQRHIIGFIMGIVNTLLIWPTNQYDLALGPYLGDIEIGDNKEVQLR